ncbi:CbtB domain-containing protein [Streptomyces sp. NP-1717]|uniref:CbtB domain-containing protein n=1 Tax=unclassified Streptomyces TaxID=2593676 RepID=UPI001F5E33B8|nr:CbtB domain-containing protein [Streptomyces sp. NP-1717]MCI3222423.1 CbtB-domain containing protein [Streptomyces sp. NP-1717]WTA75110.1 CbtB domain-containing protein [Streptomyces sp. NBC_00838]
MAESIVPPAVSPTASAISPLTPLPLRAVLPWVVFVGTLMLVLLYFVGAEQGATSVFSGAGVHEWVHDGRHLLGFPCH